MNHASHRDARYIELDADGNAINTMPSGQAWRLSAVRAAQESQSFEIYRSLMSFLDAVIGEENDTKTVKAYDRGRK